MPMSPEPIKIDPDRHVSWYQYYEGLKRMMAMAEMAGIKHDHKHNDLPGMLRAHHRRQDRMKAWKQWTSGMSSIKELESILHKVDQGGKLTRREEKTHSEYLTRQTNYGQ